MTDDIEVAEVWTRLLSKQGIKIDICIKNKVNTERLQNFSIIIVDVTCPLSESLSLIHQFLSLTSVPILFYTVERDEGELIRVYDMGVSECICKPIGVRLFSAKIKAWLDRCVDIPNQANQLSAIYIQGLHLQVTNRIMSVKGREVKLTPLECSLLSLLLNNPNQILSTSSIVHKIWGYLECEDSVLVKNVIYRLRHKINTHLGQSDFIQSVPGKGYFFDPKCLEIEN